MVLQGIAAAVFAVFMGVFLVFYIKSRGQYDEYMEYVDKEEYGLKDFIPIAWLCPRRQTGRGSCP